MQGYAVSFVVHPSILLGRPQRLRSFRALSLRHNKEIMDDTICPLLTPAMDLQG